MTGPTLLVVDDEADNLDALERIFRKRYRFLRANSGAEALDILKSNPDIDVIITDQRMPQMTGVELLEKTLQSHPDTVRILLTGYTEIDSIIAAVNQGHIFRYITKPWDSTDLSNSVDQAMEHYSRGKLLQIKNQELEKALSDLKLLDEAKSKFMILINHELKTPLTVISSFLGLLAESRLDDEQKTFISRIDKSAQRLQEIIDDTFILTHHAAGTLKPKFQTANLLTLANETWESLIGERTKKNLSLQGPPSETPTSMVVLDATLMRKALKHLFMNAIRFAPSDSAVSWTYLSSPNSVQLSVENSGPAIPDQVLNKLHTPFNLQSEIMNHTKGLGLGLSVADAILQIHRSRLDIQNRQDSNLGSMVRVSFTIKY